MLWFKAIIGFLLIFASSAGCGFKPMYGHHVGDAVLFQMAAVDVSPMRGLLGVEMYNQLRDNLMPGGKQGEPKFQLDVEFRANRDALITAKDSQVRRFNLVIDASYSLADIASGKLLTSGRASAITNYNVVESSNFGTSAAEEAAHLRGVRQISEQIAWAMAVFFKQRSSDTQKIYESSHPKH